MFDQVWKSFSDEFFKTFKLRKMIMSILFWACVFCVMSIHYGWSAVESRITGSINPLVSDPIQLSLLIGGFLLGIYFSAKFVDILTFPMIRFLEGYWRFPFSLFSKVWISSTNKAVESMESKWQELSEIQQNGHCSLAQIDKYTYLEDELSNYPVDRQRLLPTRFGNILRAAEEYPYLRYGLESTVIWPRMWLILPDNVKNELGEIRNELDDRASFLVWVVLFLPLSAWVWWVVPIIIFTFIFGYKVLSKTAKSYGTLIRAAFDLYRFSVYKSLLWPIPINPHLERETGLSLTLFLQRGIPPEKIKWVAD